MTDTLVEEVMEMMDEGAPSNEIIAALQERGYSNTEIQEAIHLAQTKASVESEPEMQQPPEPEMQPSMLNDSKQPMYEPPMEIRQPAVQQSQITRDADERIEEIAESIIEEKWQKAIEEIGDLSVWKEKVRTEILSIKQEVMRIEGRFESLQNAVLSRIKDYDKNVENVTTDVKAVEKLLSSILQPLTNNVKELKSITEKLKR